MVLLSAARGWNRRSPGPHLPPAPPPPEDDPPALARPFFFTPSRLPSDFQVSHDHPELHSFALRRRADDACARVNKLTKKKKGNGDNEQKVWERGSPLRCDTIVLSLKGTIALMTGWDRFACFFVVAEETSLCINLMNDATIKSYTSSTGSSVYD